MLHNAWNSKGEMPYCLPRSSIKFQGHRGQNITNFDPNWAFPDYKPVAAFKSRRFALFSFALFYISDSISFFPSTLLLFFSCDQAALRMVFSVCLSVRLSVRLSVCPSHLFDYVPIIVSSRNFQELSPRTRVTSMQKIKVRGQRSRSQRSQPNLTVSGL